MSGWQLARVVELDHPMAGFVRIRLELPEPPRWLAGQHWVVRLSAADGYTAQRSYSSASDPADPLVELLVERLPDGEVSGHLHDEARVGDLLEVRGPIGRWFVWDGSSPAVAVAGGSGLVPIVSMVRHAARIGRRADLRVVALARTRAQLPYAEELEAHGAFIALTRENHAGRVAAPPYPEEVVPLVEGAATAFVCGSVGFVGYASRLLAEAGMRGDDVRVEQFGVTG